VGVALGAGAELGAPEKLGARRVGDVEHDRSEVPVRDVGDLVEDDDRVHEVDVEGAEAVQRAHPHVAPGAPVADLHRVTRIRHVDDPELRVDGRGILALRRGGDLVEVGRLVHVRVPAARLHPELVHAEGAALAQRQEGGAPRVGDVVEPDPPEAAGLAVLEADHREIAAERA
jgi:hypothetical protein